MKFEAINAYGLAQRVALVAQYDADMEIMHA
jgi:hypothetical protein